MREQRDELVEFDERAGPAMREQQRQGCPALSLLVDEVEINAIDRHGEVMEAIEHRLLCTPVVVGAPVIDQRSQILPIGSKGPVGIGDFVGPASGIEPLLQIEQQGIIDRDNERSEHWPTRFARRRRCHEVLLGLPFIVAWPMRRV
jgi:hypothetical protein